MKNLDFPTFSVEGVRIPRLILGQNPFVDSRHFSEAKALQYKRTFPDAKAISGMIIRSINMGVNAIFASIAEPPESSKALKGIEMAQKETGGKLILLPYMFRLNSFVNQGRIIEGIKGEIERVKALGGEAVGGQILAPIGGAIDALLRGGPKGIIEHAEEIFGTIRDQGLIPAIVSHDPRSIPVAEERGYDVGCYFIPVNKIGHYMDYGAPGTTLRYVKNAKKPVIAFKTLAFGRIPPREALEYVFSVPGIKAVSVGIGSEEEMDETYQIAREAIEYNPRLRISE